ncbi:alternate-type signal peptide domain-containing protein [Rhodococcus sp. BP-316]|uniref:alternate-type signal peptide domain-containing protein n=1 Tax=Rhodococcus sp. BP-316 TaxID=2739445 RepID=UPI001C9AAA46|nr:alternate-type signal peptide domain-containing protein [Rhodococcus sp. BP-316]MBY6682754.1 alternate-type signal peptide domain-containing protein [Rhodococcus sp. BP-316]
MNKATKGAMAAGAAALLLLGGAGSFALWQDSESVDGATITAGNLDISPLDAGVWTDVSPGPVNSGLIPDIAAFRMVPGDVLEYTASYTVTAEGENLRAVLTADPDSVDYTGELNATIVPVEVVASVDGVALDGNAITEDEDGTVVDVVATVTFDAMTPDQVGTLDTVDLSGFLITLQQSPRT